MKQEVNTDNLLGLRGVLCLWIYSAHFYFLDYYNSFGVGHSSDFAQLNTFEKLLRFDFLAVDLFFIMSGFLLFKIYGKKFTDSYTRKDTNIFLLKRLARIYPVYVVGIAIIALFHLAGIPHPISSGLGHIIFENWEWTLFINMTMLNSWGIIPVASWNEPSWTVSAIFMMYLIFHALVKFIGKLPNNNWLIISIAALLIAESLIFYHYPYLSASDGAGSLIRIFAKFTCGCLLFRICESGIYKIGHAGSWVLSVIFLFIFFTHLTNSALTSYLYMNILLVMFTYFLLYAKNYSVLNNAAIKFVGMCSYSIYILHYPYLLLVRHFVEKNSWQSPEGIGLFAAFLFITVGLVAVSAIAYHLIEKPAYEFAKMKLKWIY